MTTKHVNSDSLNMRSSPRVAGDNIVAMLTKAQEVTLLEAESDGWVPARAQVNGSTHEGYVAARYLRDPVGAAQEALIAAAIAEWLRFDRGAGKEHHSPYYQYVGEMWRAINLNLDGQDRDQPWSAAFISWVVRQSGEAYEGFKHAAAHARYIHDSIRKRQSNVASPFWGFRLNEHKVQLGDLVCQWRVHARTFDDAARHDSFFSHCDVVVELDGGRVRALGGNVNDSVRFKNYSRDANGFMLAQNNLFAVLRNNA
ncbi:MAG: DUF2272 domain-containing protein [Rhizobiaceae bacterium]